MLRNYLTTAVRALRRRPGFTLLNAAGLTVGLACCLLIALYVRHELSYDRFHAQAERIYRVAQGPADAPRDAWSGAALRNAMAEDLSGLEHAVRLDRQEMLVAREDGGIPRRFKEPRFFFADSAFFSVFDGFRLTAGDAQTALAAPGTVVLTEAVAQKYFGDENPMGQRLLLDERLPVTVTGVAENPPANSHVRFDFVASMGTLKQTFNYPTTAPFNSYFWPTLWTYVLLEEGTDAEALSEQLPEWIVTRREAERAEAYVPHLQPLSSLHLQSDLSGEIQAGGSLQAVYVFVAIAAFILLLACTNFVNLSTARAAERAREVGVRRAAGAQRWQVALQFFGEGLLLSLAALVVALGLARALLPAFEALAGLDTPLAFGGGAFWAVVVGAAAVTGLVAGLYPAVVLSGFRPAEVLKGAARQSATQARVRRGLVVFQFAVSIALIAATAIAYQQLRFLQSKDLGFDAEQIVSVPLDGADYDVFKSALTRQAAVDRVTGTSVRPGFGHGGHPQFETDGLPGGGEDQRIYQQFVDYGFFETLGIRAIAGRTFAEDRADEGRVLDGTERHYGALVVDRALVLNRAAVERMGWATPAEALGQRVRLFTEENGMLYGDISGSVVGVVEDYHTASLREEIQPVVYHPYPDDLSTALVKTRAVGPEQAMAAVQSAWSAAVPERPFEASLLDADLDQRYRQEARTGRVLATFSALALLIAALGLFGLAAYAAEARRKEIAVRKVLGASAAGVVALLSKDFLKLVALGFLVAAPLAWYAMAQWLEGFAYRVELSPLVFAAAGAAALVVAATTVSWQALRAARTNPAQALRDE